MAETSKINIKGELEPTKTPDSIITTLTRAEVVGKRAEAQTVVDHFNRDLIDLNANLVTAMIEVDKWDEHLENTALK